MQLTPMMFFITCPLVFLGGFVDAIAGGGGIITLPAYLLAGVPIHLAIGSNKFSSSIGTCVSTFRLWKNNFMNKALIVPTVLAALCGSSLGAYLSLQVGEAILKYMMLVILPIVAFYVLKGKNLKDAPKNISDNISENISEKFSEINYENVSSNISADVSASTLVCQGGEIQDNSRIPTHKYPTKLMLIATLSAFLIGGYDGFYGPGTGTFLILVFTGLAHMDVKTASGNAKVINLASNLAALVTFLLHSTILIPLACVASIFSIAGHYIGSGLVIKNGSRIIRPIIIVVLLLLFIKILSGR